MKHEEQRNTEQLKQHSDSQHEAQRTCKKPSIGFKDENKVKMGRN
jgi:hypothetical protein